MKKKRKRRWRREREKLTPSQRGPMLCEHTWPPPLKSCLEALETRIGSLALDVLRTSQVTYVCTYVAVPYTFILRARTVIPFPIYQWQWHPRQRRNLVRGTTSDRRRFAPNKTDRAQTHSTADRIDRPSALTRDHSGRGAIRRITPMRRLSLFLQHPLSTPRPSCSHPFSPSSLFLASSSSSRASSRSPTAFPPFYAPSWSSLFLSRSRARARNRACGCARSCLVVSLPRLASPYLPTGATASRVIVARYREFLRLLATRRSLPWRHDRKFN